MSAMITYEKVFHSTSNGVIVVDREGFISLLNYKTEQILAECEGLVAGRRLIEILPAMGKECLECLRSGKERVGQHIIEKDTSLVINVSPVLEKGQPIGAVCNFQELDLFETSAKRLDSYKQLAKQFETIFKSSSDGIWVCNGEGIIINLNEASQRLNGIEADEVIGRNVSIMEEQDIVDRNVTPEVIRTKRQVSILQYVKRTGKYLLATGTPALDEDGNVALVVVNERDMTYLNELKEKLDQSYLIAEKMRDELMELSLTGLDEQDFVAEGEKIRQVLRTGIKLSRMDASNILILGESGTGKGLFAKFIHRNSPRCNQPFIQINCATLPENLLEAELFGYEHGAFTGARTRGKVGLIELADGGTLFLDEIGDLPLSLQAKLLKYLDDQEVMRLGGVDSRKVDCTIIAATNRDIESLARKRQFRQDLFFRLNMFTIKIPPLRERSDEIFALVQHYLKKYNQKFEQSRKINAKGMNSIQKYHFPGNIRELKNIIQKAVIMSEDQVLDEFIIENLETLPNSWAGKQKEARRGGIRLQEELLSVERELMKEAMSRCGSTIELARVLGISQPTAFRKMKKHSLAF